MQCSRAATPAKNFTAIFLKYKVKSEIAIRIKRLSLHITEDRTSHSFRPTSEYRNLTERGNGNRHFQGRNWRSWCRPEDESHVGLPKLSKDKGRIPVQFITKHYGVRAYGGAPHIHTNVIIRQSEWPATVYLPQKEPPYPSIRRLSCPTPCLDAGTKNL